MSVCILLRFRVLPTTTTAAVAAAAAFFWGCLGCNGCGDGLSLAEATMASPCLASPRRPRLKGQ